MDINFCEVIEFGAVLDSIGESENLTPIEELPTFHRYTSPKNGMYIGEPFALSMHSSKFLDIADRNPKYKYCNPQKLGHEFKLFLLENEYKAEHDKITINVAGKNFGTFDLQFLERLDGWDKHINVRHSIIDPSILYWNHEDDTLPSMSECKKRAGFDEFIAHDAISDCFDVVKLIRNKLI